MAAAAQAMGHAAPLVREMKPQPAGGSKAA